MLRPTCHVRNTAAILVTEFNIAYANCNFKVGKRQSFQARQSFVKRPPSSSFSKAQPAFPLPLRPWFAHALGRGPCGVFSDWLPLLITSKAGNIAIGHSFSFFNTFSDICQENTFSFFQCFQGSAHPLRAFFSIFFKFAQKIPKTTDLIKIDGFLLARDKGFACMFRRETGVQKNEPHSVRNIKESSSVRTGG